jgi:prepilin-type N-terminal cleavage/methylation domain-containing protein
MKPDKSTGLRRGVTFLELVVVLVVSSVLVLGLSMSLALGLKVSDPAATPAAATLEGNDLLMRMAVELPFAQTVTEKHSRSITVTAPDRNGGASAETIRYHWSGIPGSPVTRAYNGGVAAAVAVNVADFEIQYVPADGPIEYLNIRVQAGNDTRTSIQTAIPLLNAAGDDAS